MVDLKYTKKGHRPHLHNKIRDTQKNIFSKSLTPHPINKLSYSQGSFNIDNLLPGQRRKTKEVFNLCIDKHLISKNNSIPAFQTDQNNKKVLLSMPFFHFLPTQKSFQLNRVSQIDPRITHENPKRREEASTTISSLHSKEEGDPESHSHDKGNIYW